MSRALTVRTGPERVGTGRVMPSTSRARVGAIEAAGSFPERIVEMARDRDAQTEGGPG